MGKQYRRLLAVVTGGMLFAGLLIAPAYAAGSCDVLIADTSVTFAMSGTSLTGGGCDPADDVVTVTGTGDVTFNLAGGLFKMAGTDISFLMDLTPDAGNSLTVNGGAGADRVWMSEDGVNFEAGIGSAQVEELDDADSNTHFEDQFATYTVNGNAANDSVEADGTNVSGGAMTVGVVINGGDGNDDLDGGDGGDVMHGNNGNDSLRGGLGADQEFGDAGADTLIQENDPDGGDLLNGGGDGRDVLQYSGRSDTEPVSVSLNGIADDGGVLELDNVSLVEIINGGDGNDTLTAAGVGSVVTINGNEGNDTITGGSAGDALNGNEGTDTLNGGDGRDKMNGGEQADTENGQGGNDVFNQSIRSNGGDVLNGGTGTDKLNYGSRRNPVRVDISNTVGDADDGQNTGVSEGDDAVDVEVVYGGRDEDRLISHGQSDRLYGGPDDDFLDGQGGIDKLYGQGGNDTLDGDAGNDRLFGGSGNDSLDGDTGTDYGNGGRGADTCQQIETQRSC